MVKHVRVKDSFIPIKPNIRIIAAVIFSTSLGPVIINAAQEMFSVQMGAKPVFFPCDEIRPFLIPSDNAFVYLFFCECKYKAAADRLAVLFSLTVIGHERFFSIIFISVDKHAAAFHELFEELFEMSPLFIRYHGIFILCYMFIFCHISTLLKLYFI